MFPPDPEVDAAVPIDDPDILDFLRIFDGAGNEIPFDAPEASSQAVTGVRRTPLAARLRAVYGDVENLDAFVGMLSEPHPADSELGPLQEAIWRRQFTALRDGDRFFYLNDPALAAIYRAHGISYRHTLAQVVRLNSGLRHQRDLFRTP